MKYSPFDSKNEKKEVNINKISNTSLISKLKENINNLYKNQIIYLNLKDSYLFSFETPREVRPLPTENDYKNGYFIRFFIKKRNDSTNKILEIDNKQFQKIGELENNINKNIYFGIQLDWKITGPKNDIVKNNIIEVFGIQDTNQRIVLNKENEMPGITKKLINFLEFAKITIN
jgi:hypothetical protein